MSSKNQKKILSKNKWEYVINFLLTVIGVFLGVLLANRSTQSFKNESTINSLNLLYSECAKNLGVCMEIYKQLNDTSFNDYAFPLVFLDVSNKLIQDDNFYSVGNTELYSLLLFYQNEAKNLNMQLDRYTESYINDKSLVQNEILILNTSMLIAQCYKLRQILRDLKFVSHSITNNYCENFEELNKVAQAVLDGNFKMAIKDSNYTIPKSWKRLTIKNLYPY